MALDVDKRGINDMLKYEKKIQTKLLKRCLSGKKSCFQKVENGTRLTTAYYWGLIQDKHLFLNTENLETIDITNFVFLPDDGELLQDTHTVISDRQGKLHLFKCKRFDTYVKEKYYKLFSDTKGVEFYANTQNKMTAVVLNKTSIIGGIVPVLKKN